jgi:hypothetical protein
MSRAELAEAINAWLWSETGRHYALDAHAVARYERNGVRWPIAPYRAALRAVLHAASDADLGFSPPARHPYVTVPAVRDTRTMIKEYVCASA